MAIRGPHKKEDMQQQQIHTSYLVYLWLVLVLSCHPNQSYCFTSLSPNPTNPPILLFLGPTASAPATYLPTVDEQRNIHSESNEQQAQKQNKQDQVPAPRGSSSAQGLAGAESRSTAMWPACICAPLHLGVEYEVSTLAYHNTFKPAPKWREGRANQVSKINVLSHRARCAARS